MLTAAVPCFVYVLEIMHNIDDDDDYDYDDDDADDYGGKNFFLKNCTQENSSRRFI
jgi:hypothetical protein